MDMYVTRQPIFDTDQKVIGYELLYQAGFTNRYGGTDATEASLAVIRDTCLFLGQRIVSRPSQVLISLARDLLLSGVAGTFYDNLWTKRTKKPEKYG